MPLKILLIGNGKLGKAIFRLASKNKHFYEPTILKKGYSISKNESFDCVVDVSQAGVISEHLPFIKEAKIPLIIGTTGQDDREINAIDTASKIIPVMLCQNFSQGIFFLRKALTSFFPDNSSCSIEEIHHKDKKDAPSGTAKLLQKTLGKDITIESKRIAHEIGLHTVTIKLEDETIKFSHQALHRDLFAKGALKACQFIVKKKPGLYSSPYCEH